MDKYSMEEKRLLVMARIIVIAAFLPQLFTISLGFFTLTPFRLSIIISVFINLTMNNKATHKRMKKSVVENDTVTLYAVWIGMGSLSLLWCSDFSLGINTILYILFSFIGIIIILRAHKNINDIWKTLEITIIVIILHLTIGIYESISGNYFFSILERRILWYQMQKYPISMFFNTNNFGMFCFYSFSIGMSLFRYEKKTIMKLIYIVVCIISVYLISLTGSRAAILAVVTFCVMFIIGDFRSGKKSRKLMMMSITILAVIYVVLFRINVLQLIFGNNINRLILEEEDIRMQLIYNGGEFLLQTVGIGIGAGSTQTWLSKKAIYDVGRIFVWHNWWVELAVEFGIVVFMFYITLFVKNMVVYSSVLKDKYTPDYSQSKLLSNMALSLSVGFIVAVTGPSTIIEAQWVWMMYALMLAIRKCEEMKKCSQS